MQSKHNLINELYLQLSGIKAVADSMTNMCVAWEMPVDTQSQIHGISQSIMALTEKAEKLVSEIEQTSHNGKPSIIENMPSPRMADDIDKVNISKLSVTDLHEIYSDIASIFNRTGTSQAHSDYFRPLWEELQDALYATNAVNPRESLLKLVELTKEDLGSGYAYGPALLKEAQQFVGVSV